MQDFPQVAYYFGQVVYFNMPIILNPLELLTVDINKEI